jgi:hypothetical protein
LHETDLADFLKYHFQTQNPESMKCKQINKLLPVLLLLLCALGINAQNAAPVAIHSSKDSTATGAKQKFKNQLWMGLDFEPQFEDVMVAAKDHPLMRDYKASGGLTAGFNLCYQLGRTAGIETGLEYKFSDIKTASSSYKTDEEFHGMQIPALLTLHTHGQKFRFFCAAGFAIGADFVDEYRQHVDWS